MEYEQFLEEIKQMVRERLDADYSIEINTVLKNNSIELDAIVILKKDETISPNIYLNEYFENYKKGATLNEIINEILEIYFHAAKEKEHENFKFESNFDHISDRIFYRVVNYEKNKKLLKDIPNIKFLDLAITFHWLIKDDESGIGCIRVTREYLSHWGITVKELLRIARKNTPLLFPIIIRSMNEVIFDIIKNDLIHTYENSSLIYNHDCIQSELENSSSLLYKQLEDEIENENNIKMYVLSNTKGINGASAMLYKNVIKDFANKINSDLYILPSSIHEIILVPCKNQISYHELSEMVFDVNQTQVSPEEILSNKVYYYNKSNNKIE